MFWEVSMPRRKHRTPTRTFSNAGPVPRYTGYFPTEKTAQGVFVFDSIACMNVALLLDFLPNVKRLDFEPEKIEINTVIGSKATRKIIPDFRCIDFDGVVAYKEAKSTISQKELEKIEENKAELAKMGLDYMVIESSALVKNGIPETLLILKKYRNLFFDIKKINRVITIQHENHNYTLEGWVRFSKEKNLDIKLIYHLLATSRLRLEFVPIKRYEVRYV